MVAHVLGSNILSIGCCLINATFSFCSRPKGFRARMKGLKMKLLSARRSSVEYAY